MHRLLKRDLSCRPKAGVAFQVLEVARWVFLRFDPLLWSLVCAAGRPPWPCREGLDSSPVTQQKRNDVGDDARLLIRSEWPLLTGGIRALIRVQDSSPPLASQRKV